jgi:CHASE1-domain containing sensor protein
MNGAIRQAGAGRKAWPAWIMLGIGLLITLWVSLQVKRGIEHEAVKQAGFTYDQATLRVQERLNAYALILRGAAGLFATSDTVTRQAWRAYVEKLRTGETVPGVQGIGFAQLIPPEGLARHVEQIRQEGFPDYSVRPPGQRAITSAIIYLEPFRDRNLRAFGFDMFSEPTRRAAMEQARDTGSAALSGKVELVQETGKDVQSGTLMYVPVYRNGAQTNTPEQKQAALLGWAYSPYRMTDLMTGVLHNWAHQDGKTINLEIYDGLQAQPAALLFDNQQALAPDVHSLFYQQRTIDFYGRPWLLVFDRNADESGIGYAAAWSTLFGGVALSGLLFGLLLSVINTRSNAERLADELTATIRLREASLEHHTEALIRSNAELSRLGEVMTHHFQEPARRLVSFAQRLLSKSALASDEDSRQSLNFIEQQARRLSALVLDVQRYLALDHTEIGTVDSASALRQSIASAGEVGADVEIVLHEPLPRLWLAEKPLRELFAILLDNALCYRHPQRPLRIEVSATTKGDRAVFCFADNGSGIAPEYREQVLGLFTRLVPSSVPGTGMGLALAYKITGLAGGRLHIEDGLNGGTCVVFDLPLESKT